MSVEISNILIAFALSTTLGIHGFLKKKLSFKGSITAFIIGLLLFSLNLPFGLLQVVFYLFGSKASKYKKHIKQLQEQDTKDVKNSMQVFCVSGVIVACAILLFFMPEKAVSITKVALAATSCNLGDTLASEFGSVLSATPVLIIKPWKRVPPGTNGGISFVGTAASFLGGALTGAAWILIGLVYKDKVVNFGYQDTFLFYGGFAGFIGSILDSILGSTLQSTHFCIEKKSISEKGKLIGGRNVLTNEGVNFFSCILTGIIFYFL